MNFKLLFEDETVTDAGRLFVQYLLMGLIAFLLAGGFFRGFAQTVTPALALEDPAIADQDDMCIWLNPDDPAKSVIITSDKKAIKLFVYDLYGNTLQTVTPPGKPGNIDIRYNFPLNGQTVDIIAFNDRGNKEIAIYKMNAATQKLEFLNSFDAGNWPSEIYGFTLYRNRTNDRFYAIASGKSGQLRQWELIDNNNGGINGLEMRTWINGPGGITEGLVADDEFGRLFAANETNGIFAFDADPAEPTPSGTLVAEIGKNGLTADVEGLTIYYAANGEGYLMASSQGSDEYKVYERKPPYNFVKSFKVSGATGTDGIDVINVNLGLTFPSGIFLLHNDTNSSKEVLVCDYADLGLAIDTDYWNPRGDVVSAIGSANEIPQAYALSQNFPNPFNPSTNIRYQLRRSSRVSLIVYDIIGRPVATLVDQFQPQGSYTVTWTAEAVNGRNLPTGIYFAKLHAGDFIRTIKMSLLQ